MQFLGDWYRRRGSDHLTCASLHRLATPMRSTLPHCTKEPEFGVYMRQPCASTYEGSHAITPQKRSPAIFGRHRCSIPGAVRSWNYYETQSAPNALRGMLIS